MLFPIFPVFKLSKWTMSIALKCDSGHLIVFYCIQVNTAILMYKSVYAQSPMYLKNPAI